MTAEATSHRGVPADGARRWLQAVLDPGPGGRPADTARLAARLALAWVFAYHGGSTLFGWFGGPGLDGASTFFADTAHLRPGGLFAVLAGVIELGGALALVAGLAARLAALLLVVDMVMAIITVTGARGIQTAKVPPGYELNLALAALALVVVLLGAGGWSLDAIVGRRWQGPGGAAAGTAATTRR